MLKTIAYILVQYIQHIENHKLFPTRICCKRCGKNVRKSKERVDDRICFQLSNSVKLMLRERLLKIRICKLKK